MWSAHSGTSRRVSATPLRVPADGFILSDVACALMLTVVLAVDDTRRVSRLLRDAQSTLAGIGAGAGVGVWGSCITGDVNGPGSELPGYVYGCDGGYRLQSSYLS